MEFIPCPDQNKIDCPVRLKTGRCFEDVHHIYWPKRDYKGKVEEQFRELEVNKVVECRDLHNTEHALEQPPDKPDLEFMRYAIARAKVEKRQNK